MKKKLNLSRRYFLRGSGMAVALPAYASLGHTSLAAEESVAPKLAETETGAPLRMAFMSIPNGVQQDNWFPEDGFQLNNTMKPLEKLCDHLQVISGLDHINATPGPDGAGDHARAGATFLTGMRARKTAGSDIQCGISVDQVAAQQLGKSTRLPSLELTSDLIRNSGSYAVVRDLEQRVENAERFRAPPETEQDTPAGIPKDFGDYMTLMYDMLLLAFKTDSTRIATLLLAYDGSNRTFPHLGIREGHHWLTHSQREQELAEKVARIDQYYVEHFAAFLQKMRETEDVDGKPLLHNSMLVYGAAIADGNRHTHESLPVILAGHAGGAISTGRFHQSEKQPMSNLFVSMLELMGVSVNQFGDSNGKLSLA